MALDSYDRIFNFPQAQVRNLDATGTISTAALTIGGVAIATYIDTVAAGLKMYSSQGVIACAGNPNYPAATQGDAYVVSTSGKIGGASGQVVTSGDVILCNTTTVAGDHATVGSKWDIIQGNLDMTNVAITGGTITGLTDVKLTDDSILTLGTTLTNAATKVTLEFDKTTTGIGQLNLGDLSNPQVLNANPGASVVGSTINILHSAGAGNCDDLIGSYVKTNMSGAGDSGTTMVGHASRAYVSGGTTVCGQVYGSQPWAKHLGTGTVTAMSALSAQLLINDADAFTATNSINAGHFHISTPGGAANGAITCSNFDGVMVEVYPNVTGLKSMLHLAQDSTTVITSAIKLTGTKVTNIFEIAEGDGCVVTNQAWGANANGYLVLKVGSTSYKIPFI